MVNGDVISMPDKWEYPWYAAWDLAFHAIALAMVDVDFAKQQLELMLSERYLHPNGQIPAYEWNFGDVNPPVHAWATCSSTSTSKLADGEGRRRLPRALVPEAAAQLHLVGQPQGPDAAATCSRAASSASTTSACSTAARRCPPAAISSRPTAPRGWRSSSQNMLEIALELARQRPGLRRHGRQVRRALPLDRRRDGPHRRATPTRCGTRGRLLLRRAAAARRPRRRGSRCARWSACCRCARRRCFPPELLERIPELRDRIARTFLAPQPELAAQIAPTRGARATAAAQLLAILDEQKLRRVLARMLDENEFLEPARHPLAVALPPRRTRTSRGRRRRSTASTTCRPSRTAGCSAATPTGAGRSGCR